MLGTTRSVRRRIDFERPVEREVIEECIDLACQAPTGIRSESWRFLVLTEPEPKRVLADLYRKGMNLFSEAAGRMPKPTQRALTERLHEMPALILVCCEGRPPEGSLAQQVGFYGSILPAAWSLMLALRSRSLGATWTSIHLVHADETARALGIPETATQTILLPVGYTKDAVLRRAERRPAREVTYWNRWGATSAE